MKIAVMVIIGMAALTQLYFPKLGLNAFCEYLLYEEMDTCTMILNDYFEAHPRSSPEEKKYKTEVDSLVAQLRRLDCVDSCFYGGMMENSMPVMKTNPPMVDILMYHFEQADTFKYILRMIFRNPSKVVFLRRWVREK